jgi:hypothetical protein
VLEGVRLLHTGEKEGGALELVLQKLLVRFERANPFALGGQLRLQHLVLHDELLVRVRFFLPFVERLSCSGRKDAEELSGIDVVTAVRIFVCAEGAIFHILPDGTLAFSGLLRSLTYSKFHRVFLVFAFVRISVHSSYYRERLGHGIVERRTAGYKRSSHGTCLVAPQVSARVRLTPHDIRIPASVVDWSCLERFPVG